MLEITFFPSPLPAAWWQPVLLC